MGGSLPRVRGEGAAAKLYTIACKETPLSILRECSTEFFSVNSSADRKIRFSEAAFASGNTPKALRNWLQRGQVTLYSSDDGGWRNFTLSDVLKLSLVRAMVDFGLKVEDADRLAQYILVGTLPDSFDNRDLPFDAIPSIWTNIVFLIAKSPAGDAWSIKSWFLTDGLPHDFGASFLVLQISGIIHAALARLSGGPSKEWSESVALVDALDEVSTKIGAE